jgi:hypothetical protein
MPKGFPTTTLVRPTFMGTCLRPSRAPRATLSCHFSPACGGASLSACSRCGLSRPCIRFLSLVRDLSKCLRIGRP